jgi:Putative zinc-finger
VTAPLAHGSPDECPSQLTLDRLFAEELNDLERARLQRHLAGCGSCAEALAARQAERDAFVPDPALAARLDMLRVAPSAVLDRARIAPRLDPRLAPPRAPSRRWTKIAPAALALASCAALLALTLRPRPSEPPIDPDTIDRRATPKGGSEVQLFVQRRGQLVPVVDGGRLHPGDQLQVVLHLAAPRFVALYSRDGAGTISRYAPIDSTMVEVVSGEDASLPNSTVLDDVLGPEVLAVFFCEQPQAEALLRAHVAEGRPAGCDVHRLRLDKVRP